MTESDAIGLPTLSVEQERAVDLLLTGKTDAAVATAVGVTRQTVCRWRRHHPVFRAELNGRRKALSATHMDRLRSLVPKAIATMERAVEGGDWRAAAKALELVGPLACDKDEPITDPMEFLRKAVRENRPSLSADLLAGFGCGAPTDAELRQALAVMLASAEPDDRREPKTAAHPRRLTRLPRPRRRSRLSRCRSGDFSVDSPSRRIDPTTNTQLNLTDALPRKNNR